MTCTSVPRLVLQTDMNDKISFLKARYCHSVLNTASTCSDEEARHLVECLATELLTPSTSTRVKIAERNALAAIYVLSERLRERSVSSAVGDWKLASSAISQWIASVDDH